MEKQEKKFGPVIRPGQDVKKTSNIAIDGHNLYIKDLPGAASLIGHIFKNERDLRERALKTQQSGYLVFYDRIILNELLALSKTGLFLIFIRAYLINWSCVLTKL